MSFTRIDPRIAVDGVLVTAAGAAVRLDSAVPGRRPVEAGRRRRHHEERHQAGDQDTVTLHAPEREEEAEAPDPVESLRRGGFRRPA